MSTFQVKVCGDVVRSPDQCARDIAFVALLNDMEAEITQGEDGFPLVSITGEEDDVYGLLVVYYDPEIIEDEMRCYRVS